MEEFASCPSPSSRSTATELACRQRREVRQWQVALPGALYGFANAAQVELFAAATVMCQETSAEFET